MVDQSCNYGTKTTFSKGLHGLNLRTSGEGGLRFLNNQMAVSLRSSNIYTSYEVKMENDEYDFDSLESLLNFVSAEKFDFSKRDRSLKIFMSDRDSGVVLSITLGSSSNFIYITGKDRFAVEKVRDFILGFLEIAKNRFGFLNSGITWITLPLMLITGILCYFTPLAFFAVIALSLINLVNIKRPFVKFNVL